MSLAFAKLKMAIRVNHNWVEEMHFRSFFFVMRLAHSRTYGIMGSNSLSSFQFFIFVCMEMTKWQINGFLHCNSCVLVLSWKSSNRSTTVGLLVG